MINIESDGLFKIQDNQINIFGKNISQPSIWNFIQSDDYYSSKGTYRLSGAWNGYGTPSGLEVECRIFKTELIDNFLFYDMIPGIYYNDANNTEYLSYPINWPTFYFSYGVPACCFCYNHPTDNSRNFILARDFINTAIVKEFSSYLYVYIDESRPQVPITEVLPESPMYFYTTYTNFATKTLIQETQNNIGYMIRLNTPSDDPKPRDVIIVYSLSSSGAVIKNEFQSAYSSLVMPYDLNMPIVYSGSKVIDSLINGNSFGGSGVWSQESAISFQYFS